MCLEVDSRFGRKRFLPEVVVRLARSRALQAVDAAEAAVVAEHDEQRMTACNRGRDLGIHHEVTAVPDQDRDYAVGVRHLYAESARNLVPHAGVTVLEVIAARLGTAPQLVQLAGEPARGADDRRALAERAVDGAQHLRVRRQADARARRGVHGLAPLAGERARALAPGRVRLPTRETGCELLERREQVAADGKAAALDRVVPGHIDRDEARVVVIDQLARARREIL